MAGSLNKVCLIGNLGKDPEIRRTQDGRPIVNLSVATSDSWKDKNTGEKRERTEWHRVVIWNENLAKVAEQYLSKGKKVYLEGALQTRKWQDQSGQDRYSTEIVLQGFGCQLVLLTPQDRQDGGGYPRDHIENDNFGRNTQAQPRAAAPADNSRAKEYGGYAGSGHGDMNDEVPF